MHNVLRSSGRCEKGCPTVLRVITVRVVGLPGELRAFALALLRDALGRGYGRYDMT